MRYLALDFETANGQRTSIVAMGYALFEDGELLQSASHLCKPYPYEFNRYNTRTHGITKNMVAHLGDFASIYHHIQDLDYDFIVAHNTDFDLDCLFKTASYYKLPLMEKDYICTMHALSGILDNNNMSIGLKGICKLLNIGLEHHQAESDAIAAGKLFWRLYTLDDNHSLKEFALRSQVKLGHISSQKNEVCDPLKKSGSHFGVNIKNIEVEALPTASDSPFSGKSVVFTGEMDCFPRTTAAIEAAKYGAILQDNITKKTNILFIGNEFLERYKDGYRSGKMKKAEQYREAGQDIQILFEKDFLIMLEKAKTSK